MSEFGIYFGFHIEHSVLRSSGALIVWDTVLHMVTSRVYKSSYSRCSIAKRAPTNTIVFDRVNELVEILQPMEILTC